MSETTRPNAVCTDEGTGVLEDEHVPEDDDALDEGDVLWVPPEQPPKRGFFGLHEGELVLFATCDDCGATTRTTPEQHLFVPCANAPCNGEITLEWNEPPA